MPKAFLLSLLFFGAGPTVDAADNPQLPSGPPGPGRFGAYYTNLGYTPEWDAPWRIGPETDIVVRFDDGSHRLVFWHGTNYIPCWVNDKGTWYSDGAVVRPGAGPYQDRWCFYSFVSVVETSDARTVIRWRYAPVNKEGKLINLEPITRWNDWVDEFYSIYPDATGVRRITLHSTNWEDPFQCQESIVLNQPGQAPVEVEAIVIGSSPDARNIQIVGLAGSKPFQVVPAEGAEVKEGAPFGETWGDWPVTGATAKPGLQFLNGMSWKPRAEDRTHKSWIMLIGLSAEGPDEVKTLARSWLAAPDPAVDGQDFSYSGYDAGEKCYRIACSQPGAPSSLKLAIQASKSRPIVNPAFVITGWGKADPAVSIDGNPLEPGTDFRYGFRKTDTVRDLIVWLRCKSEKPISIEIDPLPQERR
jgi:hypothetical protein